MSAVAPTPAEAFDLLTIPNATLTAPDVNESGTLHLVCVTVQHPDAADADRDVYLMMRVNDVETPIDPAGTIQRTDEPGSRTYTFQSTDIYPADRIVKVPTADSNQYLAEDLETFDNLLGQYSELRGTNSSVPTRSSSLPPPADKGKDVKSTHPGEYGRGLRGQLVAINQDTGEVIGQFDDTQFKLQEDPAMREKGHQDDVVHIEVPEFDDEEGITALEMFVRAIPPEEQDWITTGATVVSHAISQTTNLLLTSITAASSMYMAYSAPSPHHTTAGTRALPPTSTSTSAPEAAEPPPPALVFLTSENTRKNLATVHDFSTQAVAVSSKTVSAIDNMIRRAMGSKVKQPRRFLPPASGTLTPNPPGSSRSSRAPSPSPESAKVEASAPPPYPGASETATAEKLPIPEVSTPSPAPPLPPRTLSGAPEASTSTPPPLPPRLRKRDRVILSLDLIFSTLDQETRRFLESSTQTVGTVVGHKYGPEAAQASMHIAGAAKNVGLVYVDMSGIGRKALLKRVGREFVKGRIRKA